MTFLTEKVIVRVETRGEVNFVLQKSGVIFPQKKICFISYFVQLDQKLQACRSMSLQ